MKTYQLSVARPQSVSFVERVGIQMIDLVLRPLDADQRITVLMSLLAGVLPEVIDDNDPEQIEAILEMLRMQLLARP